MSLDSLLVQFWTSHPLRLKLEVMYESTRGSRDRGDVVRLLPEVMKRGIAELVKSPFVEQPFPSFTMTFMI